MKLSAKDCIKRHEKRKAERLQWDSHWQEVLDYTNPRKNSITRTYANGAKRNTQILDNTAVTSAELLAGALHGLLTNPYSQWFNLLTGVPEIDMHDDAREWLQDSEQRMLNVLNDSNFQTEVHEYYLDLVTVGTGVLTMEEDPDSVVRFNARFIAQMCIEENSKGNIDEVSREWKWKAKQIAEEFGVEDLPERIAKAYKEGTDTEFTLIHAVYPRDKNKSGRGKYMHFDYISQVICVEDAAELEVKGFNESPYIVARWSKASDETYGRGPGMTALPESKIINKMTETIIKAAQKVVDPPLQLPDDGFILPLRTYPGGLNFRRAGSEDRIEPVFNRDIRVDFGFEAMAQHRERIRQAFYVDQLLLSNVGPQMTATEVTQRTEERMRLLGPMLGRQNSEFLSPMIGRLFNMMQRRPENKGGLKPMPAILGNAPGLTVQYSSVIARMQRVAEGVNIERTLAALAPFISMDPTIIDNFEGDMSARKIASIYGYPQVMIRNQSKIKEIRDARAEAQRKIQEQQNAQAGADQLSKVAPAAAALQQKVK